MKFHLISKVDSTNALAKKMLTKGKPPPFCVVAEAQTKGRGRGTNNWSSPKGNLYASMVFAEPHSTHSSPPVKMSFCGSLAVADFIQNHSEKKCQLKWPNDILLNGAKVGGILVETHNHQNARFAIVGVGVNLRIAPIEGAVSLGLNLEPLAAAKELAGLFEKYHNEDDFENIINKWKSKAFCLGQTISLTSGGERLYGKFHDINQNGALILETKQGTKALYAAESNWGTIT